MARNLRLQRSRSIGIALPLGHEVGQHLTDPFFLTLVGHVADVLVMHDYDITLTRVLPTDDRWLDRLVDSGRIDGLILIGQSDQGATIERVARRYPPLVVWGAALEEASYPTVGSDNIEGGRVAARHLLALDRRKFAFIGNPELPEFGQRLDGFREVAATNGVHVEIVPVHMTLEAAAEGVAEWWAQRSHIDVDAIFAGSDVTAIGAIRALSDVGVHVPTDVAVVGYDDITLAAHTTPGLTTIRQDIAEGARWLVEALFARLNGEAARSRLLAPELIVRESTGSGRLSPARSHRQGGDRSR